MMSDPIAVLNHGCIEQVGHPDLLYASLPPFPSRDFPVRSTSSTLGSWEPPAANARWGDLRLVRATTM
jgi:hypothetical protein